MLNRNAKSAFYSVCGPFMAINGRIYRSFRASKRGSSLKVHLGPGQKKYLPGWVNIDANMFSAKCDVWADLRLPLPLHDESVLALYSHHVIEHLPNLREHFRDVYRCLQEDGVYRIGGPNGDNAIKMFIEKKHSWFDDFPDSRRSIGGRLDNFIFCRNEHLSVLTFSYIEEILTDIGFAKITQHSPVTSSGYPELFCQCMESEWETDPLCPHTLIIEATKTK